MILSFVVILVQLGGDTGKLMTSNTRKTSFIGFLTAIQSAEGIFNQLVLGENPQMKYLLTYKLSQDHQLFLELSIHPVVATTIQLFISSFQPINDYSWGMK